MSQTARGPNQRYNHSGNTTIYLVGPEPMTAYAGTAFVS